MVSRRKMLKQQKVVSEDVVQVKTLIILLLIVALVCVGIYFLTDTMIKKESSKDNTTNEVKIDYDIATIGTMFNRIEEEYYVLMYSNKENGSDLNSVLDSYRSSDNYVKTYYIDLDKKINSIALKDELVKNPASSNEVSVTGATLFKIKDGKAIKTIDGIDKIIDVLK